MKLGGGMGIGPKRRAKYLGADPEIGADQGMCILRRPLDSFGRFVCTHAILVFLCN